MRCIIMGFIVTSHFHSINSYLLADTRLGLKNDVEVKRDRNLILMHGCGD